MSKNIYSRTKVQIELSIGIYGPDAESFDLPIVYGIATGFVYGSSEYKPMAAWTTNQCAAYDNYMNNLNL